MAKGWWGVRVVPDHPAVQAGDPGQEHGREEFEAIARGDQRPHTTRAYWTGGGQLPYRHGPMAPVGRLCEQGVPPGLERWANVSLTSR